MNEMPGQRELLNVCFACLRYSRVVQSGLPLVRPASAGSVFVRGGTSCSRCRFASSSAGAGGREEFQESKEQEEGIESNPFYEKYKAKLQHLAEVNPEELKWRLQKIKEDKKPKTRPVQPVNPASAGASPGAPTQSIPKPASYTAAKGLESVMKMELIQDKSAAEVEQIWKDYHTTKDCVFAVLKKDVFEDLMEKARKCPIFLLPLPRADGFEFILMQFEGNNVQFTPLAMYQVLKENAPACLTLVHYTELMDSKGIVLMSGEFDDKVLKTEDAVLLVQMVAIYYGKNSARFDIVETFNHQPDKFDHNQLVEEYKSLYQDRPAKTPKQPNTEKQD